MFIQGFFEGFLCSFEAIIVDFLIIIDVLSRLSAKKDLFKGRRLYALIRALKEY